MDEREELMPQTSDAVEETPTAPVAEETVTSATEELTAEEPVAEVQAETIASPLPEEASAPFVPPVQPMAPQPMPMPPVQPMAPQPMQQARTAESGFTAFLHKLFPPDEKLRNGHLIFNVLAIVIALVCGFSILFAPIVSLDLGVVIGSALEVAEGVSSEREGGMSESTADGATDESTEENMFAFLGSALKGVSESLKGKKLTISAMTLWTAGNSDTPLDMLGIKLLEENQQIIEEATITVTTGVLVSAGAEQYISTLPEEEQAAARENLANVNYDRLTGAMLELNHSTPENKEEVVDTLVETFTDELSSVIGELDEDSKTEIKNQVSQFYDYGVTEEGTFDMEQMICTAVGSMMGSEETLTDYASLLQVLMNGGGTGGDTTPEGNAGVKAMADEVYPDEVMPGEGATEETPPTGEDAVMQSINQSVGGAFKGVAIGFFLIAGVWFLMALLAFIHIFLRNRKFSVWYALTFGGSPALIWVLLTVLPNVFGSVFAQLGMSELSGVSSLLGAISSGMWIVGVCYLLTAVLSIVMIPYHKKMKAEMAAKEAAKRWQGQFVQPV